MPDIVTIALDAHVETGRLHAPVVGILLGILMPLQAAGQLFQRDAESANLQWIMEAGMGTNGVSIADYDADGDLDVYFVVRAAYSPANIGTRNRLFSNNGNRTFLDVTSSAGAHGGGAAELPSYMGYKLGASWGDYDNDGYPDLFLTHAGFNHLLHNNGNGTFSNVTQQAGVAGGATQVSTSAVWFDYDLDGDLDLYVGNWADYNTESQDLRNWMYENLGNGQFYDVSVVSGLADSGKTWMTVSLDVNNDALPDLYLANDFGDNKLYVNNGNKTFSERTEEFGLEDRFEGMGLAVADVDGNGYFDIYLTNVTEKGFDEQVNPLFLNTGTDSFVKTIDVGASLAGWGWGTEFLDFDNDGDEDLFVVNGYFSFFYPKRLFRNLRESDTLMLEDVAHDAGLDDSSDARGLAVFDFNNDGSQDILISNFTKLPALFGNPGGSGNWLKVSLEGTTSNRNGFGAVVEIVAGGMKQKKYHHGAQFLGQSVLPVHFGLGNADVVDSLIITWPGGTVEFIGTTGVNQALHVLENSGIVAGLPDAERNKPGKPDLTMLGNYPNPFNNGTHITFVLAGPADVELKVFNVLGQTVSSIRRSFTAGGKKSVPWYGTDRAANRVGTGVYYYTIRTGRGYVRTGRMICLQ